jgi:mannosyltransferase
MGKTRSFWPIMVLFGLIGLAVRAWHIGTEPFWLDEAYSAYAADKDWNFLIHVVPKFETHPPVYYSLMHIWARMFGDNLLSMRMPGLLAGLAAPFVMLLAAREVAAWLGWDADRRNRLYLATFGLACVSNALVEMTRQVRPYPLMILVYAAALALMLRLARLRAEGRPLVGRAFAAYFLLLETMLWLHNLGPLYALSLTIGLAIVLLGRDQRRADLGWLVAAHLIVGLLYLPGLAILQDQAPTWVSHTWLRFSLDQGFFDHLTTLYAAPGWPGFFLFLLLGLAILFLIGSNSGRRLAGALLVLALLPVVMAVAVSLAISPVFITRTMTPVAVPAMLLLAVGAAAWTDTRKLLGVGAALILGASMLAADVQARMAGPMQDWYRTVAWLSARFEPGDQIFAYPNEGALPLQFALRDKGLDYPIRPIPTSVPSFNVTGGWYPTGSRGVVSLPREQLRAIARQRETEAVPTIWLLRLGAKTYDPGDMFLQELHRDRYVVRSWQDGPIDIIGLKKRP